MRLYVGVFLIESFYFLFVLDVAKSLDLALVVGFSEFDFEIVPFNFALHHFFVEEGFVVSQVALLQSFVVNEFLLLVAKLGQLNAVSLIPVDLLLQSCNFFVLLHLQLSFCAS